MRGNLRLSLRQVAGLAGIGCEGRTARESGRSMNFTPLRDDARERRPAAVERSRERLEIGELLGLRPAARRPEAGSGRAGPDGAGMPNASRIVGRMSTWLAGGIDDARRRGAAEVEDERDPQRRLVREDPVRRFAVISERLAVIRGDDHQRVRRLRPRRESAAGSGRAPNRPLRPRQHRDSPRTATQRLRRRHTDRAARKGESTQTTCRGRVSIAGSTAASASRPQQSPPPRAPAPETPGAAPHPRTHRRRPRTLARDRIASRAETR